MRSVLHRISALAFVMSGVFSASIADPLPKGFESHRFNGSVKPATKDGVTSFHIKSRECSKTDYGDGRGENDCINGNIRSNIRYRTDMGAGESVEYKFDFKLDPGFAYKGWRNQSANGFYPDGWDSHLRIASWEGTFKHNFIYMLKADTRNGVNFLANQCQKTEDFGKWATFSLKVRWADDGSGWANVACDGRVIYALEGEPTNQSPHCWESNECEPQSQRNPKSFNFILGPVMMGWGNEWMNYGNNKSQFDDFQPDGIAVQMRNISVTRGVEPYSEAQSDQLKQLQLRLTELGCEPGNIKGRQDKKTREAAAQCRKFPDGKLPAALNLATLQTFVDLYSDKGAEALPKGQAAVAAISAKPKTYVKLGEMLAMKTGRDPQVNSNFYGKIKGAKKGQNELDFILLGYFGFADSNFRELSFILQDVLSKAQANAAAKCGFSIIDFPDGTKHVEIAMRKNGAAFAAPANIDCLTAALPKRAAAQLPYLTKDFGDLAKSIVSDGTVKKLRHEGLKVFMTRVAAGEIIVGG